MSSTQDQQLSRGALVALVVGSMVGSGIFTLPSAFGRTTGVLGALIAWCIAGAGIVVLAWHKLAFGATATFAGFLLVIAAALSWAVGNISAKHAAGRRDVDMLGMVVWSSLAAPLPLAVGW